MKKILKMDNFLTTGQLILFVYIFYFENNKLKKH